MIYKYANCKKLKETTFPNPKSVRIINNGEMTSTFNELLNDYINPYNCHYITGFLYNLAKEITEESHEETATSIGDSAFSGCSNLWDITVPESVTSIGNKAFYGCSSLREIIIPESVICIGDWAFSKCSNLKRIIIPESVTSIGEGAFFGCSGLIEITIPESVVIIRDCSFTGCYNLRKIDIPKSAQKIGEKAFWGCPIKSVNLPPKTIYKPDSFDEVTKVIKAKVAISYSWDSDEHKAWVRKLANDLHKKGVYVILDQWELKAGQLIPDYMEKSIQEAERVICIMTSNYKKKSDKLEGGVGYEYSIIKREIYNNINSNKILPILREGSENESCPSSLSGRLYLDFRRDDSYENSLNLLLREIFKVDYF